MIFSPNNFRLRFTCIVKQITLTIELIKISTIIIPICIPEFSKTENYDEKIKKIKELYLNSATKSKLRSSKYWNKELVKHKYRSIKDGEFAVGYDIVETIVNKRKCHLSDVYLYNSNVENKRENSKLLVLQRKDLHNV